MACMSSPCVDLGDSTRTTAYGGSTITDLTTESDLSSDICSPHHMTGCLQDFMFHGLIGRGKFSQVFVATHIPSGTTVAVKKVQIFEIMEPKARFDCIKEVKILQSLEHPNVVKCYQSFIENNELVMSLEWAEAGDLGHVIKTRRDNNMPFAANEVLYYLRQVCSALKHMHDRRMMHRDLKPTNIFLTSSNILKLGDLGLSRYFSSKTLQAQTLVGTPYYMSPEAIRSSPYDFSSDIWSLGCLLYELIALRNPFYKEGLNFYLLGKIISNCQYEPLPSSCPQQLRSLVTAMLQPDPKSRPSAEQVLAYADAMAEGRTASLRRGQGWPADNVECEEACSAGR